MVAMLMAAMSFAQIQIDGGGKAETATQNYKHSTYISWEGDGYYFHMLDYECSKISLKGARFNVYIYLGQNDEEVKQSADILKKWYDQAANDAFITVTNPNGDKLTIYKYNANIYASYGNEQDCRNTRINYGLDIAGIFLADDATLDRVAAQERQVLIDNIAYGEHQLVAVINFKKDFLKSIKNF